MLHGEILALEGEPPLEMFISLSSINRYMSDDVPLCPDWWPRLLWNVHFWKRPWPGPGLVNYPPIIEDIMSNLHIHTFSYMMRDQNAAQEVRKITESQLSYAVGNLSQFHQEKSEKK